MGSITDAFAETFRDYVVDGLPSSGAHDPVKSEIRAIGPLIESAIGVVGLSSVDVIKSTRSLLNADLAWAADSIGLVTSDATDANNDLYIKVGGTGTGSWTLTTMLHDIVSGLIGNQVQPYVDAAEAAQAGAETARDDALAAQAAAEAAAASVVTVSSFYGSVRMPNENGENRLSNDNGMFYLNNSQNLMASGHSFAAGDWSIGIIWNCPIEEYNAINRSAVLIGNYQQSTAGLNRTFSLHYCSNVWGGSSTVKNRFTLNIRGESGTSANWQIISDAIPSGTKGPIAILARSSGGVGFIDFWDMNTGTKITGSTTVAPPTGWAGIQLLTYNIGIGGARPEIFPFDDGSAISGLTTQNVIPFARGSLRDALMVDDDITDAQWISIMGGADPVATVTSGLCRLHAPLVDGAGSISLAITTNQAAMLNGLTKLGNIYPGGHLKPQASAKYLTIDRLISPCFVAREIDAQSAPLQLTGKYAGLSGLMECMIVNNANQIVRDWHPLAYSIPSAGLFSTTVNLPRSILPLQIRLRLASDTTVIGVTHNRIEVGLAIHVWGQSEVLYGTVCMSTVNAGVKLGTLTALATKPDTDISTVHFATFERGGGSAIITAQNRPGLVGDAGITIANYIRRRTLEPVMIIVQAVGGTKVIQLVNDADTARNWSDALGIAAMVSNRGKSGEYLASAHVFGGWEQADGQTDMAVVFDPFFRGVGSSYIAQSIINHYLYNGEISTSAKLVVMPNNRQLSSVSSQTSDRSAEADQRDYFRSYASTYGYIIGPETTLGKIDMAGPYTHPKPADAEGDVEYGAALAECICLGVSLGSYSGPSFFTSAAWVSGSGNTQIDMTLANPVKMPGLANAAPPNPSAGTLTIKTVSTAVHGFEVKLSTAGSYSISNVTSAAITNPRTVRITLASAGTTGQTSIAYHSGGPGDYGSALDDTLFRGGGLVRDGFPISGSNVPITI